MTVFALRAAATVHAAVVLVQPVLAGRFLAGDADAIGLHAANAGLVVLTGWLLAGVVAVGAGRRRLPAWLLVPAAALCAAEVAQAALGFARVLGWHVPLGVLIFALASGMAAWSWRRPARVRACA